MISKLPELPAGRPWRFRDLQLHVVLLHLGRRIQDEVCVGVASQPDVKAGSGQGFHLASQDLLVGRGLGQDVVRVHKGPALRLAQAVDLDAGKLRVPALPGRQDPSVAIDQVSGGVDACRHDPPELIKAAYKFVELRLRVLLRVPRVGDQLIDLPPYQADRRFCHFFFCPLFQGYRRGPGSCQAACFFAFRRLLFTYCCTGHSADLSRASRSASMYARHSL